MSSFDAVFSLGYLLRMAETGDVASADPVHTALAITRGAHRIRIRYPGEERLYSEGGELLHIEPYRRGQNLSTVAEDVYEYRKQACAGCAYWQARACTLCGCTTESTLRRAAAACPHPEGARW